MLRTKPRDASQIVAVRVDSVTLDGSLQVPVDAAGLVLFAHGSGSSRRSPRNNFVAEVLRQGGIGTLLFDLLTEREDVNYEARFDIDRLTERVKGATAWARKTAEVAAGLPLGYFGASTGAAAALAAASELGSEVAAVVSRGGRPDLAEGCLHRVVSPTLLIVASGTPRSSRSTVEPSGS